MELLNSSSNASTSSRRTVSVTFSWNVSLYLSELTNKSSASNQV